MPTVENASDESRWILAWLSSDVHSSYIKNFLLFFELKQASSPIYMYPDLRAANRLMRTLNQGSS
jgi:hypothetical protein